MFPYGWPVWDIAIENCANRKLYFDNQIFAPGDKKRVRKSDELRVYEIGEPLPETDENGRPKVKPVMIIMDWQVKNRSTLDEELRLRPKRAKHLSWLFSCVDIVLTPF